MDAADSYDVFFRATWKRVLAFAGRRVGADSAPDIASDAMLTAWLKWDSRPSDDDEVLVYWVLAIAKNKALHEWRRMEASRRLAERLESHAEASVAHSASAELIALSKLSIVDSFQSLNGSDQAVLSREHMGSHSEAGREPEMLAGAQAMRKSRARRRLLDGIR